MEISGLGLMKSSAFSGFIHPVNFAHERIIKNVQCF